MQGMRCDALCGGRVRRLVVERLLAVIVVLVHRRFFTTTVIPPHSRCILQVPVVRHESVVKTRRHTSHMVCMFVAERKRDAATVCRCFSFCFPCLSLSVPSLGPLNRLILSEQVAFVKRWRVCRSAHRRRRCWAFAVVSTTGTRSTTLATEWWAVTPS